jgi:hypothetical protein
VGRNEERGEATVHAIVAEGGKADFVRADLRDAASAKDLAQRHSPWYCGQYQRLEPYLDVRRRAKRPTPDRAGLPAAQCVLHQFYRALRSGQTLVLGAEVPEAPVTEGRPGPELATSSPVALLRTLR